ncbi:MAG: SDR family NAD(P)-dependent oxidoreductase [Actinobacteria bacterium]|nr:SDR family NAD(P)-dependent oxidoreductase [Actinomycetota bacterium]
MKDLPGKVAVVTGGAGGIGRALGERFATEGMKVVLADIDEPVLDVAVKELRDRDLEVIGAVTDTSDYESVERLRDATLDAYGAVHLVCNNAGIPSGSDGYQWEHHLNDWRWAIDVNVFGIIHGINAFVPTLLDQGGPGHVVNTSSSNGAFYPLYNSAVYSTTKAAVTTITECLWGQLRAIDAPVTASVLLPSTRTGGILNTGIFRPGRNRPERYSRPGQPPLEGRDALTPTIESLKAAGEDIKFADLSEVADVALEGILEDRFWITMPNARAAEMIDARAASMRDRTSPNYLLAASGWNVPKK